MNIDLRPLIRYDVCCYEGWEGSPTYDLEAYKHGALVDYEELVTLLISLGFKVTDNEQTPTP